MWRVRALPGESPQKKDNVLHERPQNTGLSFPSGKSVSKSGKRKAVGDPADNNDTSKSKPAKKSKKAGKALLSFGDGYLHKRPYHDGNIGFMMVSSLSVRPSDPLNRACISGDFLHCWR
jgi:hypothetical protein